MARKQLLVLPVKAVRALPAPQPASTTLLSGSHLAGTKSSPRPVHARATTRAPSQRYSSTIVRSWDPPQDAATRSVVVVGAGVLGRRLAVMWASTGRPVTVVDTEPATLRSAVQYIGDALTGLCAARGSHPGRVATTSDLDQACLESPWMVVEAVPEDLQLKRDVLARAEHSAPADCILATNSSTWPASEMADSLKHPDRLVNSHYTIPPRNTYVELMSSGLTNQQLIPFLAEQMTSVGLKPIALPAESVGFVFNRIWAACKRETLRVLSEGTAKPEVVDALFRDFFHSEKGPCEKMDEVGLDTVAKVEANLFVMDQYKGDISHLEWLEEMYVEKGKLGEKTGDGLFSQEERLEMEATQKILGLRQRGREESKGA